MIFCKYFSTSHLKSIFRINWYDSLQNMFLHYIKKRNTILFTPFLHFSPFLSTLKIHKKTLRKYVLE